MKLMYLDLETTGLLPSRNAIIQIAGSIIANGETEDFDFRVRPHEHATIDAGAMSKTGITEEIAWSYPSSEEVFKQFIELLGKRCNRFDKNDKYQIVGYNSKFDDDFLRKWFERNNDAFYGSWFWNPPLDIMQLAAFHLAGSRHTLPNFKLSSVYFAVTGKELIDAHDAAADIAATKEILNTIWKAWKV